MAELWNRSAKLEFGIPGETGVVIDTSVTNILPQISFDIFKSIKDNNTANISIFNLGETSREIVNSARSGELFCELAVGYSDDNFTVFKGNIQTGGSKWNGKEWITTLKAVDGLKLKKVKYNKSHAPKTDIKKIMEEVLAGLGSTVENVIIDVKKEVTENGLTLSGTTPLIIEKLMNLVPNQNLELTVQDNIVYVKPATELIDKENVQAIGYDTGMIGAPKKTKEGVEFEALIRKGLSPGRGVDLEVFHQDRFGGVYIIQKTRLKGSLRGSDWVASCEAKRTDNFVLVGAP